MGTWTSAGPGLLQGAPATPRIPPNPMRAPEPGSYDSHRRSATGGVGSMAGGGPECPDDPHDRRIIKGRQIAGIQAKECRPNDPTHDLPGTSLGQRRDGQDQLGLERLPELAGDPCLDLGEERRVG